MSDSIEVVFIGQIMNKKVGFILTKKCICTVF